MKKKYELTIKYYTETEDYVHLESLFSKIDNFYSIYDFYVSTIKFDDRILKTIIKNDLKDISKAILENKEKLILLIEETEKMESSNSTNKNLNTKLNSKSVSLKTLVNSDEKGKISFSNNQNISENHNKKNSLEKNVKNVVNKNELDVGLNNNINNNDILLNDRIYNKLITLKNFIWKKKSFKNTNSKQQEKMSETNINQDEINIGNSIKSNNQIQNNKKIEDIVFKFIEKVVILNIIEIADVEFNNTKFQRELFYYATNKVKEDEKIRLKLRDMNVNEKNKDNYDESIEVSFYLLFFSLLVSFALIYFQIIYTT